jgi:hypothetical protein
LQTEAPLFTPFAYLRRDEFGISRIIADLLDPNGRHSQGALFLTLFMEAFGLNSVGPSSGQARVTTEYATAEGRRIDIVIRDRNWIIAIENKPWARDGELQVSDYLCEIRPPRFSAACLVYLTKDARAPTGASIGIHECKAALACGELKLASYEQVLDWLSACRERCLAESVRNFLSDFHDYLREEVMIIRRLEMGNPIVDCVLAEDARQYLQTTLAIAQQKDAIACRRRNVSRCSGVPRVVLLRGVGERYRQVVLRAEVGECQWQKFQSHVHARYPTRVAISRI